MKTDIPSLNPEDESTTAAQLDREHMRPEYSWRGKPLWPYSKGSELVLNQVRDVDTNGFRGLTFVFVHLKRGGASFKEDLLKSGIMELAWNLPAFRAAIIEFTDDQECTDEDISDAIRIEKIWLDAAQATRIKAGSADGAKISGESQKKTEPIPDGSHGEAIL